jgi:hypothetical protein
VFSSGLGMIVRADRESGHGKEAITHERIGGIAWQGIITVTSVRSRHARNAPVRCYCHAVATGLLEEPRLGELAALAELGADGALEVILR